MINLHKLEIFSAVVQAGAFSTAAENLLMTQPAVSQHIHDLEASLGVKLFHRGRRGVELTPAGETLNSYSHRIFELMTEAELAVGDVKNLAAGQITIGATPGAGIYLLPDWVQEFRTHYPNLSVVLQTGITTQVVSDVRMGRIELGLIEGEPDPASSSSIGVLDLQEVEQLVVVGRNHPWWSRTELQVGELQGQTLITRQRNSQTRIWLEGILQQYGIHAQIGAEFDAMESIKRGVARGTCVAVLPEYVVRSEVEMGALAALHVAGKPLQRVTKLLWNKDNRFTPVVRAFLRFLTRHLPAVEVLVK